MVIGVHTGGQDAHRNRAVLLNQTPSGSGGFGSAPAESRAATHERGSLTTRSGLQASSISFSRRVVVFQLRIVMLW
jgi:hypothetical protein